MAEIQSSIAPLAGPGPHVAAAATAEVRPRHIGSDGRARQLSALVDWGAAAAGLRYWGRRLLPDRRRDPGSEPPTPVGPLDGAAQASWDADLGPATPTTPERRAEDLLRELLPGAFHRRRRFRLRCPPQLG